MKHHRQSEDRPDMIHAVAGNEMPSNECFLFPDPLFQESIKDSGHLCWQCQPTMFY